MNRDPVPFLFRIDDQVFDCDFRTARDLITQRLSGYVRVTEFAADHFVHERLRGDLGARGQIERRNYAVVQLQQRSIFANGESQFAVAAGDGERVIGLAVNRAIKIAVVRERDQREVFKADRARRRAVRVIREERAACAFDEPPQGLFRFKFAERAGLCLNGDPPGNLRRQGARSVQHGLQVEPRLRQLELGDEFFPCFKGGLPALGRVLDDRRVVLKPASGQ